MLEENESVLGLDIAAPGIKLVELKKTSEGLELVRAEVLALPADSLKNGVIVEPKSIALLIKEFMQANNLLSKKTIGIINPSLTLVRLLRIPFMSETQMRDILENEANQYVDFKHKEKVIDFCLLEEINEEGIKKVNVIFAAALKEVVNVFIQIAQEANLELIGIDVATLAIIRVLYSLNLKPFSIEPAMLVMINPEDIQLCILKGNHPRFLHTVKIDIKEFIASKEEFVNRLIFSIKLALNYYSRVIHGQEDIQRIIVSINEPATKDIDRELANRLGGLSVERLNPLAQLKVDKTVFTEETKEDIAVSFGQLIGAVLRTEDAVDYPLSLNLIPLEKQKRALVNRELALYASALTILLATFIILAGILGVTNVLVQSRILRLNQQLKETAPLLDKLMGEYSKNIDLDKRINEANQIIVEVNKNKSKFSSAILAEVMVAVPEGLWLTDIAWQPKEVTLHLSGNAVDEKSIFEYASTLNNTRYFIKVEPVLSKTPEETLNFSIKCQLEKSEI